MSEPIRHPASFRDPSGFVFRLQGVHYRQVDQGFSENYELLMDSGLYRKLTEKGWLIPHTEIAEQLTGSPGWYKTLLPRQIGVVSYPCEWSPSQLKDAALLILGIMDMAIGHGMILKDGTPLNTQFPDGRPLFIDTLSFEKYDASRPWIAYRQFCECCLFPLYLHHFLGTGIGPLLHACPEGIPAALTAKLLPWKSRFDAGVWLHVYLQSRVQRNSVAEERARKGGQAGPGGANGGQPVFSETKLRRLITHLQQVVSGFSRSRPAASAWSNYYGETMLSKAYRDAKERLFLEFTEDITFGSALDLGANNGHFSLLLAERKAAVIAVDSDWVCIDQLYRIVREKKITNLLPLCVDIADPTAAAGFRNAERASFSSRVGSELVLALALVHHLVLGRNIPFRGIASYFAELAGLWLIIEFVPLSDEKACEIVRNKSRWHEPYDQDHFERCFGEYFDIEKKALIPGTERILYRMKKKNSLL